MCGIAGIISYEQQINPHICQLMSESLAHRGPDGEGIVQFGPVNFAHRRLSIIDLESGTQPMWSHDKKYLITFNGEVYNYIELKGDLVTKGHTFKTTSDTEVILEAYRCWGEDAFARFNGQFAFALYDVENNATYLVRDHFGEKPLYYCKLKNGIAFASELKALIICMKEMKENVTISPQSFSDYMALNYIPFSETMISGIHKVNAASFIKVSSQDQKHETFNWKSGFTPHNNPQSELSELLDGAIKIRLRSDVPVGIFLSGGLDSTLALSGIVKHTKKITAFSANFLESSFSEIGESRRIAKHFGVNHEVVDIDLDTYNLEELITSLVYHGDEPLADSSALPVYLLSQATAKSVKVALSGDGGDELFGGYLTYRASQLAGRIPSTVSALLARLRWLPKIFPASNKKVSLQEKCERFFRNLNLPPSAAHFAWNGMWQHNHKALLIGEVYKEYASRETFEYMADSFLSNNPKPALADLMIADQQSYLSNDILAKVDRMSMANGLEVRPSFLDPNVREFSKYYSRKQPDLFNQKAIVKDLLKKEMWPNWIPQPKQGFSIPIHLWFRTRLKDLSYEVLFSDAAKASGLFNQSELLKLWSAHQDRKINIGFELWGMMVMQLWYKRFIAG